MLASLSDRPRLPGGEPGVAWTPTWSQDSTARIIRDPAANLPSAFELEVWQGRLAWP
jgi:hypothetical protein